MAAVLYQMAFRPIVPSIALRSFLILPKRVPTHGSCRWSSTGLKVDKDRLMQDIHDTAKWGTGTRWGDHPTETGMSRLSLSDTDKSVRDWFADTTTSLGCKLTIDEMGNMFAIRPGKKEGPPTFIGSHLDTQPTGGRYDGVLGVLAGVEVLRVLNEANTETEFPIGVVNWTNEEGARFPISMVSSGVWSGEIPLEKAHSLNSVIKGDNSTMRSELERIGYLGSTPCNHASTPMAAHFELHIEQGPLLENSSRKIGIVTAVQSYRWYTLTITGRDCHTGTTDLSSRADALLAAAKMIVASRSIAHKHSALASTGIITAAPGSTNTVPGLVTMSLDIRAPTMPTVLAVEDKLKETFADIAAGKAIEALPNTSGAAHKDVVQVSWRLDFDSPGVQFHTDCIESVRHAAVETVGENNTMEMTSGAGHDSVYTSKRVPSSMIFVPSKLGVSHNPREFTSPEECAQGAQVLLGAVLKYDSGRLSR